jgi:hypothetical protein
MKRATKNEIKTLRAKTMNLLQERLRPDAVSGAKGGLVICRWVYCYSSGHEDTKYAQQVADLLAQNQIPAQVIDSGEMWNSYHKNASVAQQPHFYVEVKLAA